MTNRVSWRCVPAADSEINSAWAGVEVPVEVRDLWGAGRELYLLYRKGAEGLAIYSPEESRKLTLQLAEDGELDEDYFHADDILVGDFQGYDQRLLFSPGDGWLVAGPIDIRADWLRLGFDLGPLLEEFLHAGGTEGPWEKTFLRRDVQGD